MSDSYSSPGEGRRERKRQQLGDRVAAVAFGLFETEGFDAVTMEQVAAAADIAKGTLYKYFPLKEALLAHQFQRDIAAGMDPLWQALEKQRSFAAQLKSLLHASAKWNEARRIYIPHYVRYQFGDSPLDRGRVPQRHAGLERLTFKRLCVAGQQRGDVRSDLSASQLAVMLDYLCLGAISTWLATPGANLKREFDALLVVALNGVAP